MSTQTYKSGFVTKRWVALAIAAWLALAIPFAFVGSVSAQEGKASKVGGDVSADIAQAEVGPLSTCGGPSKPDKDSSRWGKYFKTNGVNIRKLPSTSSTICGQGQKSHTVDYHCWAYGRDGRTWTYLRDATTNYQGWVRDDLLKNYGSSVHC